jgi:hypothetical protein
LSWLLCSIAVDSTGTSTCTCIGNVVYELIMEKAIKTSALNELKFPIAGS